MPYLSIIVPAYNEEKRIPAMLRDLNEKLKDADFSYEVLVINDGSRDKTAEVVKGMIGEIKNLRLIHFGVNRGKGAVVKDGMLQGTGEIRLFTDADNSTSIDHFEKMRPWFEKGYDVVICSRAHRESRLSPPQPWYRQIPGKIGNLIIQMFLLPGLWDTQCGFKAFTASAAEKVFRPARIERWGFDIEALALARHMGFRIKEIPVVWKNDTFSHVKMSAYIQVLLETLKIRWWLWTNKYKLKQ